MGAVAANNGPETTAIEVGAHVETKGQTLRAASGEQLPQCSSSMRAPRGLYPWAGTHSTL